MQTPAIICGLAFFIFGQNLAPAAAEASPGKIEFNRDVRPILSENCFKCHGFDAKQRKADLRLDSIEGATAEHDGKRAIVPRDLKQSSVHERIHTTDEDDMMPPKKSGKHLTDAQRAILDKWIEQGAEYQLHWSYLKPVRKKEDTIDSIVRARLQTLKLAPAPEADRATLCRRLYLDLLGLPPSRVELESFVKDSAPDAVEKLVDTLLKSPHHAERMAVSWLDVVRYADTIGFHSDNPRNVWPYRDYVIRAFNENMRFDQFTREQIAGDLLPDSTQQQKVASAFNRLNLSTVEGGSQAKDYEARTVADRVRAIGTVWLGQTFGCCQCHDHKFDPIKTRDFYAMGAFFADIQEPANSNLGDGMLVITKAQEAELKKLDAALADAKKKLETKTPELDAALKQWTEDVRAKKLKLAELDTANKTKAKPKKELKQDKANAQQVLALINKAPDKRSAADSKKIEDYFRANVAEMLDAEREGVTAAQKQRDAYYAALPKCLVSVHSDKPRTVRILPRGNWMDETGEVVQPALPAYLNPQKSDRPLTRVDLADWLVSRDNPLTARVFVNRLWKQYFGTGLSKVLDDLGTQGETPSDQKLLDWLACEFMDSGWDMRHMTRLIVTSATYRQSSMVTKDALQRDPYNRELARQGRFRLDAEFVRDNALAISGLLVPKIGGPSVKPYQPEGYWDNLNFPVRKWEQDNNENQWRRGLYTWWQRSYLQPSLLAFDAPSREECCAERVRSNIPQQALVLLNDPTYVEASRAFALRIIKEGGSETESRIAWAWKQATARAPKPAEVGTVRALFEKHLAAYQADTDAAKAFISTGIAPVPKDVPVAELAAWTSVARTILNLHETITRL